MGMQDWRETIRWAESRPPELCPGDMQSVIRALLKVIHVLGERIENLEARAELLEAAASQPKRPTAYERLLSER